MRKVVRHIRTWAHAAPAIAVHVLATGALILGLSAPQVQAQSLDELVKDGQNTDNVLTYGMGYHQRRHSSLKEITRSNVRRLVPVWNLSLHSDGAEQAQPLIYQGVMYVANGTKTVAIDVDTGRQLWSVTHEYSPDLARLVCCGINSKGVALLNGRVFRGTVDAQVVALDAKTGKELWKNKVAEWKEGYTISAAPQIANGVLITGVAGGEFGVRGFLDGWDPETGKHLWRTYTTAAPGEPGGSTWPAGTDHYKRGGATIWVTGSYDPELDLTYWGTGNAAPWHPEGRGGDNLYTASVVAVSPKTGKIVWHYQFTPNDMNDFDAVNEMVLADINVQGVKRKVLMHADRNGFFYVLDRTNGKLLSANPFTLVNWADKIDLVTGRPVESDTYRRFRKGEKLELQPTAAGAKNWQPMAFNPDTGTIFLNSLYLRYEEKLDEKPPEHRPGTGFRGLAYSAIPRGPNEAVGYYEAIDPLTAQPKWKKPLTDHAHWTGMLSTAGGVLFTGKATGEFVAIDAANGEMLWKFQTGSGINSQPIAYTHKGRQYVTVLSGIGGMHHRLNRQGLKNVPQGGSVWTFALLPE